MDYQHTTPGIIGQPYEARYNTPVNRLMDAGGWSSPAMPLRYIQAAHIANDGTARVKPAASAGTRHLIHR